jgi:UDP-N-acetylmuramoylalanine--D-glutamate ligase
MKDVRNKHIVIAGAARSGIGIALLLKQKGAIPFVSDMGPIQEKVASKLREAGIAFEDHEHSQKALEGEFLVLSPGVPTSSYLPREYLAAGKKVYSEIEAASWFNHSPIVAVTGSNGKTTVTNWLAHTWKTANRSYLLGGNIGTAFSDVVEESAPQKDALLEVSSFQLDHISTFHPLTSIILNITPDHLDRYDHNFEKYIKSKLRITENQDNNDWFIYNYDDPQLTAHAGNLASEKLSPRLLAYSCESEVPDNGAFVRNGQLILKINHEEEPLMQIEELGLSGRHNLGNGMATALAARASEINNEYIRESLRTFEGVAHRLEMVRTVDGVRYVNDSKATNINAVWYALDSFTMPIVLILGGRDKGNDYKELEKQIRSKVHTIISLGEAKKAIKDQLGDIVPVLMEADSMKQAVKLAKKQAKRGEIVLLSPACSSFDMFDNYEHRGDTFKEAVSEL